ncbi:hypothetical protein LWE61_04275 [Sphingobium sufflavum]|uniref:hypothetical protein n=1 Tax=Sphingobium sufflavum TaxID=1129547 RepID=UPI001F1AD6FD|nr:hypothetical protein [Sphingobium sufflavum]MCE7795772.1 hypothetical protein [Sphingobium sufflavum]
MRLIAWLLTLIFGLAGLALREQGGIPFAFQIGTGALMLAALSCPLVWAPDTGLLAGLWPTRKFRVMSGLALILATPLILPWPF